MINIWVAHTVVGEPPLLAVLKSWREPFGVFGSYWKQAAAKAGVGSPYSNQIAVMALYWICVIRDGKTTKTATTICLEEFGIR